jgi:hypothetical protein
LRHLAKKFLSISIFGNSGFSANFIQDCNCGADCLSENVGSFWYRFQCSRAKEPSPRLDLIIAVDWTSLNCVIQYCTVSLRPDIISFHFTSPISSSCRCLSVWPSGTGRYPSYSKLPLYLLQFIRFFSRGIDGQTGKAIVCHPWKSRSQFKKNWSSFKKLHKLSKSYIVKEWWRIEAMQHRCTVETKQFRRPRDENQWESRQESEWFSLPGDLERAVEWIFYRTTMIHFLNNLWILNDGPKSSLLFSQSNWKNSDRCFRKI